MNAKSIQALEALISNAPDEVPAEPAAASRRTFARQTGVPDRYRDEWEIPRNLVWIAMLTRIQDQIQAKGIAVLIGPRGHGKTRLAVEAVRAVAGNEILFAARYTTAMGLFLRLRAAYQQQATETESEVVASVVSAPILILDEVQERGHTPWEDRLLTHIIDARYGAMLPTILIANLTATALPECLGDSIVSRIQETGGIIRVEGTSHRIRR